MNCTVQCAIKTPSIPPTVSEACAVATDGNNSTMLQYCCGGAPIGYYGPNGCNCFAYCNISSPLTIDTVGDCLLQTGTYGDVIACNAPSTSVGTRHGTNKVMLGIVMSTITTAILALNL